MTNKNLVILVADKQQEKTLETLLEERRHALDIGDIVYNIYRHPHKDSGVYNEAADFLQSFQPPSYNYALAILDKVWDATPRNANTIRQNILEKLYKQGWNKNNCEVIVLDPELEAWVWVDSPHVPKVLRTTWKDIHTLANKHNFWVEGKPKPDFPRELLELILRQQRRPHSSAIFQQLARKVSVKHCQDPAFVLLCQTLKRWFPGNNTY